MNLGTLNMPQSQIRFSIGSMMVAIAVLGILSWLITGLVRYGTRLFGYPPLYLVVTFPFLFTLFITLVVTLVQSCRERPRKESKDKVASH